ncbi:U3 small nucleolar RNA-associated protein 18 homolog [Andrographis paniculata]|uniref:U3 small nucleolar RNA-associated protein 18 homolog n=1 Tax=Andrographis paniculata TaxID=175694 RepID=UPI0021E8BFEE|nr:U3 small nucleolar RNA-associated protein 18 homolog [Andrographis paniculata]
MSLISQNAAVKKKKRAAKKDDLMLVGEENESGLGIIEDPKKKRLQKETGNSMKIDQQNEIKKLENLLFGSLHSSIEFGRDSEKEGRDELDGNSALFFTDRTADNVMPVYEEDMELGEEGKVGQEGVGRKPVWVDEEEEKTTVNIAKVSKLRKLRKEEDESVISGAAYVSRLRAQHMKMNRGTDWAHPSVHRRDYNSEDDESDYGGEVIADPEDAGSLLRKNEDLVVKRNAKLPSGILEYSRLVDVNLKAPSDSIVNSVQFHKNAQLLLVGGLDKTLRFFQVDGKKNDLIQNVFLEDCPIRKAAFLPDGSHAIISGRRKFAYSFDLVNARVDKIAPLAGRDEKSIESFEVSPDSSIISFLGNEGYILLVSTKTKELIGTLKMNGTVRAVAFANDGQQLLSSGGDGRIYHWDLRTRTCFHIGTDEGCINSTALSVSPTGNLLAAGSDSGVVNIYNREDFLGGKRKPLKAIENLTTKVDFMKFNADAQILAIASRMKKNAMKLIHVPSQTVFSNWPPMNQALHYPSCVDFSPRGGFMALGNAAGKVMLYKLHHYHQA